MNEGASLGDPLVVSTADSWPRALAGALGRSHQESLERVHLLRRGEADATILVRDIQDQLAELESVQAKLEERELGQEAWPEGLMELRPGAPADSGIRILFAVEPPGTAVLIAVLEGAEAIQDQYEEAILLSADMLRQVRAGQAPEAAAHGYDDTRSLLAESYPGNAGDVRADSSSRLR